MHLAPLSCFPIFSTTLIDKCVFSSYWEVVLGKNIQVAVVGVCSSRFLNALNIDFWSCLSSILSQFSVKSMFAGFITRSFPYLFLEKALALLSRYSAWMALNKNLKPNV